MRTPSLALRLAVGFAAAFVSVAAIYAGLQLVLAHRFGSVITRLSMESQTEDFFEGLRFDAAGIAPPAPGLDRTWVLEVDGWCKDMDLVTGSGASLEPLPLREGSVGSERRDALHRRYNRRWAGGR